MKSLKIILILLLTGLIFKLDIFAGNSIKEKDHFIFARSNNLYGFVLQNNHFTQTKVFLNQSDWSYVQWPIYDKKNEKLIFSAKNRREKDPTINVYCLDLQVTGKEPKKLIDNARKPSLSTDNNSLAYYRHPNQLWSFDINLGINKKLLTDIDDGAPCVWISNKLLLYYNTSNEMILFDVSKKEKQQTGYTHIIPTALSPDGQQVLCGDYFGKKIYMYSPFLKGIKVIKENKVLSIGPNSLWLSDGSGFFFLMQTWSKIIQFNEAADFFVYRFNGQEEIHLPDIGTLFGGTSIPKNN